MVKKNLPLLVAISTLIGLLLAQYLHDSDSDGIPNDEDEFPKNPDEWEDTDKDGIGENEDMDDDGDGYNDTIDVFPKNAEEYYDNDLDGIGNNEDTDDDNDGYEDNNDLNPLNDVALKFDISWINLLDKQNNRNSVPVIIYLMQNSEEIPRFDNEDRPWSVPWQSEYEINAGFELNIPDNQTEHNFTILAVYYKFKNPELFDISDSNQSYGANITYNLSSDSWNTGKNGILDGSLDNSNDDNDAKLFVSIEAYNFGYLRSYTWTYQGEEYQISYNFDPNRYSYFTRQPHEVKEYSDYLNFVTSEEKAIIDIAIALDGISKKENFDNLSRVNFFLSFVQTLKYAEDNVTAGVGEYPRYPIETLIEQTGDCEDTSALLISLMEAIGYNAAIILIPEAWDGYGHAAVGVNITEGTGVHYILNEGTEEERNYYYAETTAVGWVLGEMPDLESNKAYVYEAQ